MMFYCPKCGNYTTENFNAIVPGIEFTCIECQTVYSIVYDTIFDGDNASQHCVQADGFATLHKISINKTAYFRKFENTPFYFA